MDEEYLAHYGVKGMKWGVRHDRRSSGGGSGRVSRALKRGFRAAGGAIKKGSSRVATIAANKAKASIAKQKELKEVAKDAGYSTNVKGMREFNALRNKTLSSHDPATVAKGMHTLTDSELRKKMDRLKLESQVHDIVNDNNRKAYEQANRVEQLKKARNEARASGILGKAATTIVTSVGTYAGKKAVDSALGKIKNVVAQTDTTSDTSNGSEKEKKSQSISADKTYKGHKTYTSQAPFNENKTAESHDDKVYSTKSQRISSRSDKPSKKKKKK